MAEDEITLPFIFVADGTDPPPELADFKSAHPDWVSFPATFTAHEQPPQEGGAFRTQPASEQVWEPPPRKKPTPPQPTTRTDLGAALRAFQRANAEHPDPVKALRALRDAPKDLDDGSAAIQWAQGVPPPGLPPPPFAGPQDDEPGDAARGPSSAIRMIWQREAFGNQPRSHTARMSGDTHQSTRDQLSAPQEAISGPAVDQSSRLAQVRHPTDDSIMAIDVASDEKNIQTVADEGTPGNNQVQNAQVRAVVRILGLTRAQRERLHREISGRNYDFQEVLETAEDMFGK